MAYKTFNPYKKLYKVNFASLPNQNLLSNGNHTIDGYTWTAANTGAASSFSIVNGSGIVIAVPAGNSEYMNQIRTCPVIHTNFTNFIPLINFATYNFRGIRVSFRVSTTATVSNQSFKGGFEWFKSGTWINLLVCDGYESSVVNLTKIIYGQYTNSSTASGLTGGINNALNVFDTFSTTWYPPASQDFSYGTFTPYGFPPRQNRLTSNIGGITGNIGNALQQENLRIVMCAQPDGAASAFTTTIKDMEIDILNFPM